MLKKVLICVLSLSLSIVLNSVDGKKVFEGNTSNRAVIHLPALAPALYLVHITEGEEKE